MSMKHRGLTAQPTLLALLLACSCPLALAQTSELSRVEVSGSATAQPRLDVKANCPSIELQLDEALAGAMARHQEFGTVEVELAASPDGPTQVRTSGGPRVYRQAIKQAVSRLDCFQAHAGQKFRFQLAFVSPDAAERDTALAGQAGGITLASK